MAKKNQTPKSKDSCSRDMSKKMMPKGKMMMPKMPMKGMKG